VGIDHSRGAATSKQATPLEVHGLISLRMVFPALFKDPQGRHHSRPTFSSGKWTCEYDDGKKEVLRGRGARASLKDP